MKKDTEKEREKEKGKDKNKNNEFNIIVNYAKEGESFQTIVENIISRKINEI